jgi:hypothetical protein
VVETDDNKADLQRKIMARRAAAFDNTLTNAGTAEGLDQSGSLAAGFPAAPPVGGADAGPDGDAHGPAGEGQGD